MILPRRRGVHSLAVGLRDGFAAAQLLAFKHLGVAPSHPPRHLSRLWPAPVDFSSVVIREAVFSAHDAAARWVAAVRERQQRWKLDDETWRPQCQPRVHTGTGAQL